MHEAPFQTEPPEEVLDASPSDIVMSTVLRIWEDFLEHVPMLVAGLLVLLVTWGVAKLVQMLARRFMGRTRMRPSLKALLERLIYLAVWIAGVTITAMIVFPGLTPTKALAGLGLGSIAIGFAFKDIFENFFAGVLILWRFPFEPGDFIECEGILGRVEEITVRNTILRRPTGELVILPNATLFKSPVDVVTSRPLRRISIAAGVAYGEDVDESRSVIDSAVRACETVSDSKPVEIYAREFAASSIEFEVAWWTGSKPAEVRRSRDEVVAAVKRALDDAGIEIPFPYRTLTFKEPLHAAIDSGFDDLSPREEARERP